MLESTELPNVAITAEAAVDPRSLAPWIITGQSVRVANLEDLYAWSQLAEAVRALDAAWPSLPPDDSERALALLDAAFELLANAEHRLFPLLDLTPPDRTRRPDEQSQRRSVP